MISEEKKFFLQFFLIPRKKNNIVNWKSHYETLVMKLCETIDDGVYDLAELLGSLTFEKIPRRVKIFTVCSMEVFDKKRKKWRPCKSHPMRGMKVCSSHIKKLENLKKSSVSKIQGVFRKHLSRKKIESQILAMGLGIKGLQM